jgi:ATP-dependent helicase YprA (DUF1998 family)
MSAGCGSRSDTEPNLSNITTALYCSNLNDFSSAARLRTITAEQPSKKTNEQKPNAVSGERIVKKSILRSRAGKTSKNGYLRSAKKVRKLAAVNHHKHVGNSEDCNACHDQCLLTSFACVAISIITACPPCGLVCLVYQAGCQTICNGTTACQSLNN